MRSQVLFVEDLPGCIRIDGTAGPGGAPMSLVVRVPAMGTIGDVISPTVQRWAASLDVVDIELTAGGRVTLSDGRSTLRLDLAA